ncbi:MAG: glycosyltransferase [Hyphomicrobium sp.]|jgi:glycosyltransferase involved in cell wall biosynthesis/SAM-dependent methyltransferase
MPPAGSIAWQGRCAAAFISLRCLSEAANYGAAGSARSINRIFDDSPQAALVWQPDVYYEAKRVALSAVSARVIDFGCGNGCKLGALFGDGAVELVAVDFKLSLAAARQNLAHATCIECDLGDWQAMIDLVERLADPRPTTIILADVIEHLPDPLIILAAVRSLLAMHPDSRLVLSTPDREMMPIGAGDRDALPQNEAHVREWTLSGLCELLTSMGFSIDNFGRTRSNQLAEDLQTSIVVAAFDKDAFEKRLFELGIVSGLATQHLFVTGEYADVAKSGGIGTYVAAQHARDEHSLVLCYNSGAQPTALPKGVVALASLSTADELSSLPLEELLFETARRLLLLLPSIETVELQDYGGDALRICQAKRAGLYPTRCKTVVHCHGNTHYVENAMQSWSVTPDPFVSVREKISIELADSVIFPTVYLREFYAKMGLNLLGRAIIQPPAYSGQPAPSVSASAIDTIVFLGKRTRMKGFDLFVDAFTPEFSDQLKSRGIKRVVIIAPAATHSQRLQPGRNLELIDYEAFGHREVTDFVRENAGRALFVEPYRADNFPLAVYDVVMNGGDLVAARAGGIPEIFQTARWQECLFDVSLQDMQNSILFMLDRGSEERDEIRQTLIDAHDAVAKRYGEYRRWSVPECASSKVPTATILVPFFNTDLAYIDDLFFGINQQTQRPAEVIIVDDASERSLAEQLQCLAESKLQVPFRILRHPVNQGLAGARNTALAACNTEILINIDSDDVPLSNFVRNISRAFALNPKLAVAVPYLRSFDEGHSFQQASSGCTAVYRAVGDGLIACLRVNLLGHANSGVRVETARRAGGWEASTRAKFEDWAFYLKLIGRGERILTVPSVDCLYRVRRLSMVRTYSNWDGERRLAFAPDGLPRFEALELQRHMRMRLSTDRFHIRVAVGVAERLAAFVRGNPLARGLWQRVRPLYRRLSQR